MISCMSRGTFGHLPFDCPSLADLPLVRTWVDQGWPVIVRRRAEGEDPDLAPVGVPLPPAAGKRRVALLLPPDGVMRRCESMARSSPQTAAP